MDDPFTMRMRLCDDWGMVSGNSIDDLGAAPAGISTDRTYLERHNRLARMTVIARGDGRYESVELAYQCTGHAHLAGEHILCTSPAHDVQQHSPGVVLDSNLSAGQALQRVAAELRDWLKDEGIPDSLRQDIETISDVGVWLATQPIVSLTGLNTAVPGHAGVNPTSSGPSLSNTIGGA